MVIGYCSASLRHAASLGRPGVDFHRLARGSGRDNSSFSRLLKNEFQRLRPSLSVLT
jgi:hypothetical protein